MSTQCSRGFDRAEAATYLEERVSSDDGEKPLEALMPALDGFLREPVSEDLAREGRDVHARQLALEDIAKGLEVGVTAAHDGVAKFESGDVGLQK